MPWKPPAYDPQGTAPKDWDEYKARSRQERLARKSAGQGDTGSSGPGQMVAMFGRRARRAMMHRRGDRDQVQRSRMQRTTRKRRTGGCK